MLPEGTIHNWDGVTIPIAPPLEGLDLNRNWPADWAPEAEQQGAGPFPTSEPEVRALVEAIVARKNITSYVGYHTFSGVHLRPWSGRSDDDFPVPDLRAFKIIGEEATRLTGYPSISIFHDFKYHPKHGHQGRRRRLDLRPPRRLRVGDRVLEPAARGRALRVPLHRLAPRALPRGRRSPS